MPSVWSSTERLYDCMVLQLLGLERKVFFFKALVEVFEIDAEVLGCAFPYNNKDKRPSFLPVN